MRLLAADSVFADELPLPGPIHTFESALNSGDIETAADQFADDAVVVEPRIGGLPEIYVGHDQIRWWLRNLMAQHAALVDETLQRLGRSDQHVSTRWTTWISIDAFRQLGLDAVAVDCTAEFNSDGRVASLTMTLTPPAARSLQASPASARPEFVDSEPAGIDERLLTSFAFFCIGLLGGGVLVGTLKRGAFARQTEIRTTRSDNAEPA